MGSRLDVQYTLDLVRRGILFVLMMWCDRFDTNTIALQPVIHKMSTTANSQNLGEEFGYGYIKLTCLL